MLEENASLDQSPSSDAPASLGMLAAAIPCPGCQFDLAQLPTVAKFCPRCGRDVHTPLASATAYSASLPPAARYGDDLAKGIASLPRPGQPIQKRSPILRGFARALYRLGRRYEGGMGVQHNLDEALRCYLKAAKLGDGAALARLSQKSAQAPSDPPSSTS